MDEKKKIQRVAHGFNKAFKVIRILCIVAASLCLVAGIVCFILYGMKIPTKIYLEHEDVLADITIDMGSKYGNFISYSYDVPLSEIYASGDIDKFVAYLGGMCFGGIIESVVLYVILIFFMKVFTRLETTETPFTPETSKDLKVAFILISILVALQSLVYGLVVAGLLACMYVMFIYGCKLQKNEDETL